jgi:hypothetical protein
MSETLEEKIARLECENEQLRSSGKNAWQLRLDGWQAWVVAKKGESPKIRDTNKGHFVPLRFQSYLKDRKEGEYGLSWFVDVFVPNEIFPKGPIDGVVRFSGVLQPNTHKYNEKTTLRFSATATKFEVVERKKKTSAADPEEDQTQSDEIPF